MKYFTQDEIARKIASYQVWYHNIDLNGISTNPSAPDYPAARWSLIEPYVPADLVNTTVLDLGCNAGYFAMKMRERGAVVLGVDWYEEAIDQARFVAEVHNLNIEYRLQNIYEFVLRNERVFDYVLFLGTFYHLRYPMLVLDKLAQFTKKRLYFQTVVVNNEEANDLVIPNNIDDFKMFNSAGFPAMYFIENNLFGTFNNWYACNSNAVYAILRSSGFSNIQKSGDDCFICDPRTTVEQEWRLAHDLAAIKLVEPIK